MSHRPTLVLLAVVSFAAITAVGCNSSSTDADGEGGAGGQNDQTGGAAATGGSATGNACEELCTTAGYSGAVEEEFEGGPLEGGILECTCSGEGDTVTKEVCVAYCEPYVDAEYAYDSTEGNKCACDGTQL